MSAVIICPEHARDIIQLPHPRTREACFFLQSSKTDPATQTTTSALHELITFEPPPGKPQSLLLPDRILAEAPFHVASPIDPLFFLVAGLSSQDCTRFEEAESLLEPLDSRIRSLTELSLPLVCDTLPDTPGFFRFSHAKLAAILAARVDAVVAALPSPMREALVTWPTSHGDAAALLRESERRMAWGLVSSYLSDTLVARYAQDYATPCLAAYEVSRKPSVINPADFIKRSASSEGSAGAGGQAKKVKRGSQGVEALKKVSTKGMKSMTSFFAKKAKP